MNSIHLIEKSLKEWISCNVEPKPEDVWKIGEALGQPTRKREAVIRRYNEVFGRLIQKHCVEVGEGEVCIYSWSPRAYVRYFPASIDATGTILYFKDKCNVELLAHPIPRSYDPEVRGVRVPWDKTPIEVTERVDGWQVTAYYNPILKRWIFATRYVLHNMYYEKGRLVVREYDEIANPYVEAADTLAEEFGLYDKLKGFEKWTFTFVLKGPEPAITKPPPPMLTGDYRREYSLLLIAARSPKGELLTTRESGELIKWETVPLVEFRGTLKELASKAELSLKTRSLMARIDEISEHPQVYELKSKFYQDAMKFKYLYDAKCYSILALEGLGEEVLKEVDNTEVKSAALKVLKASKDIEELLSRAIREYYKELENIMVRDEKLRPLIRDLRRARETGSTSRVLKKLIALVLEGKSILEAPQQLRVYIERLFKLY